MNYLKNNFNGEIAKPKTSFEIERIDGCIKATFIAYDSSLISFSDKDNDDLWRGNVVELFLDLGDKDFYYEFEVAPNGRKFIAKKYIDHLEYLSPSSFKSEVIRDGNNYKATMMIEAKTNKEILYNAFRIERKEKSNVLEALSPTYCDTFHVRDKFIKL